MDGQADTLQRILSAWPGAVVLTGPAASGKTGTALAVYRHLPAISPTLPPCLLIAPNAPAARGLQRQLLEGSPCGVLVSPQILTFAGLAGRILSAAATPTRMISPFARHLLLRRIVQGLSAGRRLSALQSVAQTPGLIQALDRSIAELKRAAVDPDNLAAAIGATARSSRTAAGKSADLLEIYRRYQAHLQASGLYDVEGQVWSARDELARCPAGSKPTGMKHIAAVVVDGFTDFTPTQLEILRLLAQRLGNVLITLPFAPDGRAKMWHWTGRTLDSIRRAFGSCLKEISLEPAAGAAGLTSLARNVFDMDAAQSTIPDGFGAIAAAGQGAEIAAVARCVKRLLVQGTAPGRIAVLARSLDPCRRDIGRIFAQHDIPILQAPDALTDIPAVRFVLSVTQIAPEFEFRTVLRAIKSSYFRPRALGEFDSQTVAVAEMLIREGNVLDGRDAYADAAKRLSQRARRQMAQGGDGESEAQDGFRLGPLLTAPAAIDAAKMMLDKLFDLAASATATPQGLAAILAALELSAAAKQAADARVIARDLRGLAALESALDQLPREPMSVESVRHALSAVTVPAGKGESLVDVLDVLDARAMRYDHVFLMGLGEGSFPQRLSESSLITEADRAAWSQRGVALDRRGDLTAREMLLFYLALSRADKSLTMSYLESDTSGRAAAPSSFLHALLHSRGGLKALDAAGKIERILAGQFLPPPDSIATPQDAFAAAIAGLFGDEGANDAALSLAAATQGDRIGRAAWGLLARHRRWQRGECNEFDGRLTNPSLLERLRQRFPGQTVFSASALNAYGQCPWQFFASYVLNLNSLAQPQRMLEAVSAGVFCHGVLCRVMTTLRERASGPFQFAQTEQPVLLAALDEAIERQSQEVVSRQPPYPVLWQIQRRELGQILKEYLLSQQADSGLSAQHLHFELAFAARHPDEDLHDARSSPEPVAIQTPSGAIRLQGKIDRVDRVNFDGQTGLLIVDYKTGQLPSERDIAEGRNLQLPLYAAAAEQLLDSPSLGGAFHRVSHRLGTRFFAAFRKRGGKYYICDDHSQRQADALATAGRFVQGMAGGRFDVAPSGHCPSYCEYRQICHFSPARSAVKEPPQKPPAAGEEAAT